jgi:hypothetical protein
MVMKSIIHVNQHVIRRNAKNGTVEPVFTVKQGRKNTYAHSVEILGPSKLVYSPDKPLNCGAKVWIETTSEVVLDTQGTDATLTET